MLRKCAVWYKALPPPLPWMRKGGVNMCNVRAREKIITNILSFPSMEPNRLILIEINLTV